MFFFHLNVRFANNKRHVLEGLLETCAINIPVIMLPEAWYTNERNYFIYRNYILYRASKLDGGLCILVSPGIATCFGYEFTISTPHYNTLTLQCEKHIFFLVPPPQYDIDSFFFFDSFLYFVSVISAYNLWVGILTLIFVPLQDQLRPRGTAA